jgi:acyl carrier protein
VAGTDAKIVEGKVTAFIVENFLFGAQQDAPAPDDSFMDTGLIDSTGILEVVTFLEETYELEVDDDELTPENFDSVSNIGRFVVAKRGGA